MNKNQSKEFAEIITSLIKKHGTEKAGKVLSAVMPTLNAIGDIPPDIADESLDLIRDFITLSRKP